PRATDRDYIDFLIATPKQASATKAARVQPLDPKAPAHDAFTRLLTRLEPDPETLWLEVRPLVRRTDSILIVDDTVLDKPYAHKMGLVGPFWSGKHQRVLRGINLVSLVWTDGDAVYPTDYRLVDPAEAPRRPGAPRTTCSATCSAPRPPAASARRACASTPGTPGWRTSRRCGRAGGPSSPRCGA